ncbi:cryptochrome/photolyase family protein [Halomarina oriensis]|uniref:Deoxyribodipyrimidine photo-lyase n=1 Tax=Halomarina oriensis TaxID=671145 RepID=A0A6B0GTN4_9EURY|nr:deoxyribodipyrimidine photo-lyase [Halomarina oriensis]MWG35973.1 deoxyribodipyrimidine photo-lyase [Halomarina oriensis]
MLVHWHRADLRATDNLGLSKATGEDDVLPVFVFDDEVLAHASPNRVAYMLDALSSLREWYRERDADLCLLRGDPSAVLPDCCAEHDANGVFWNRGYSGLASERDEAVKAALSDEGVGYADFHDALHHEPGSITTNDGDPYSVYTYFWKKWRDREKEPAYDAPDADSLVGAPGEFDDLPTPDDLGFEETDANVEPAGHDAARDRLDRFCESAIYEYDERRDYPWEAKTSKLSAHLKWGTVGVREVYEATEDAMADAPDEDARESVEEFQAQLAWREFYTHVLEFNPEVVTQNYKEYQEGIDWREDDDELQAWKDGETGFPIVDAGMRQLREEAWMHNRVRMVVASFLTKDLMLDWRHGYDHFREHLADHDTANDNGGWQWAASTGTDAQPYFRIFNPWSQQERYDENAEYITEYVPELAGVDAETIHEWHELGVDERGRLAPDYPAPICDHGERREAALAMFKRARGEE